MPSASRCPRSTASRASATTYVFFIALYQRWIYGVDPTRRNEFGQTLEKTDKDAKDGKDDKDAKDDGDKKLRAEASGVEHKKATLRANAAKPAKEGKQL